MLDDVSIATGAGKNALLSLLPTSKVNDDVGNIPTDVLAQDDNFSIATGVGQKALLSLLTMAGGTCNSDHLQDKSSQSEDNDELQPDSHALKTPHH